MQPSLQHYSSNRLHRKELRYSPVSLSRIFLRRQRDLERLLSLQEPTRMDQLRVRLRWLQQRRDVRRLMFVLQPHHVQRFQSLEMRFYPLLPPTITPETMARLQNAPPETPGHSMKRPLTIPQGDANGIIPGTPTEDRMPPQKRPKTTKPPESTKRLDVVRRHMQPPSQATEVSFQPLLQDLEAEGQVVIQFLTTFAHVLTINSCHCKYHHLYRFHISSIP
jgi:hypothetical protein